MTELPVRRRAEARDDLTSLRQAAQVVGVSHASIRNWCIRLKVGELRNGRWHVSRAALRRIMLARAVMKGGDHGG